MEGLVQDKYLGQVENKADEDAEEDLLGYFEYLNHGLDPEIGWRTCCKKIVQVILEWRMVWRRSDYEDVVTTRMRRVRRIRRCH